MTFELLPALAAFALVSSITPGPNNLMLMASGANFGFRRTLPHMLGVTLGFTFMLSLIGVGLIRVFDAYPVSYTVLKGFSVLYLLYLAFRIATAAPMQATDRGGRPFSFFQAALFQWVNPKGWAMALTAVTVYAPSQSPAAIALIALVFGAINLPSVSTWTLMGQQIQRLLTSPRRLRAFNVTMATLLVGSLYPVFMG
jgi:threonine/homoserine/homoserine lactone efflux protein